jgi:methylphosphotriester-DNA--protein-cysteine methyltransferase
VEEESITIPLTIAQRWNMFAHHQRLAEASAYVQRAASREWQEFMGALDAYVEQTMHNMVTAPIEILPQEQGRAQAAADIRKILRDAPKVMEKIEASKHKTQAK